ncbi:MAG: helix-turn-helix domain-containing protein [Haloarculaceae archaeon]
MSVILEFTIASDAFQLGAVLAEPPGLAIELERIVPTGDMVAPFVWVSGDDRAAFEKHVRSQPAVRELFALDRVGDSGLYRIEWEDHPTDLIQGIAEADAVILEGRRTDDWVFRLRFPDHEKLSQFHNFVLEHDLPIHIERTYTLTEETERGHRFGLTPEQREALVLGLHEGYFATPSEADLDELAAELGITRQALSKRIRRGNEKVLEGVLLSSTVD